ncbi:2,4'-dihydroxyacetophenone dioxygenase family protein [Mucilaginibacter endophyticus]|uniref:2,4'-dihydroxyacetophenone dioxygenase family protein n=1 Tax=Mucilaginibacter endophyticus TaxID=2675003 RepID=UPI000E0DCEDF|nr:2,4'-dihydroxyacetophenone dioxygenase family protein [Mucilaginibacter endophyticus]
MPIQQFNFFTDGLQPGQRQTSDYIVNTNLEDERLWIPFGPGVAFQPCQFNVSNGGFIVILRADPGAQMPPHFHSTSVIGYTLKGNWRYLEHDWSAVPGTFIYEPAGEAHTLIVDPSSAEPAMILFVVTGGFIYIDKVDQGNMLAYDDGFTILEIARRHYLEVGLDPKLLDAMIR